MSPPSESRSPWLFSVAALGLAVLAGVAWTVVRPDSSTVSIPDVTPSASVSSDSPPSFTGAARITFDFDSSKAMPYQSAHLEVSRDNEDLTFEFSMQGDRSGTGVSGKATTDRPWSYAVDKYLEVALIPGYAKNVTGLGKAVIQVAYLATVDLSAVAIQRDPKESSEAFFWSDNAGAIRNNAGDTLTSATILASAFPITVFEDGDPGVWGYFDENVHFAEPIARAPFGKLRVTSIAEGGDPGFRRIYWLGLLPAGATNLELKADPSTGSGQASVVWGAATLGTSGRLVVAGYTENGRKGRTGVHNISYTDASGQRHSFKP